MYSTNTGNFILFSHRHVVNHVFPVLSGCGGGRVGVKVEAVSLSAASSWWRLDSSAGGKLHVGLLPSSGCGPGAHPLFDFCSHGHEGLLHIGGVLGAGFQKGDAQRVCKLLDTMEEGQRTGIFRHILQNCEVLFYFCIGAKQNNKILNTTRHNRDSRGQRNTENRLLSQVSYLYLIQCKYLLIYRFWICQWGRNQTGLRSSALWSSSSYLMKLMFFVILTVFGLYPHGWMNLLHVSLGNGEGRCHFKIFLRR